MEKSKIARSSFPQYFQYISNLRGQVTYSFVKCGCSIYFFLNSENLVCQGTNISQYFRESLELRDNESRLHFIRKTCLYNFDPLKPHFYKVKLGFTGVYIILLISAQNIDCGYPLEPPRQGGSNEYPQSMF